MRIIGKLMGRDNPGEYTGYVAEVRARKQAELDAAAAEKSLYSKAKRYFRKAHPKDEVAEIANDNPHIEFESKRKRVKKYWDSIDDAPIIEPHHYAEAEIERDVKTIAKVDKALRKPKSRKQELKDIEDQAYAQARKEREAKKHAKAIEKAKARGKYYGSTNVLERTADRAKAVGRGGKKAAKAVQAVANEMGDTRLGHNVKQVMKKSNGRLVYKKVSKNAQNQKLLKSRPITTRRESLPSTKKGFPGGSGRKGSPSNGTRKGSSAGRKASSVTRKSRGFGMHR